MLGPGPRLIKKEFTGPRSHRGWETLAYDIKLKGQFCAKGYMTLLQALLASQSVTSMLGAVGNWTHLNFQ